jgi:hypothetical protein
MDSFYRGYGHVGEDAIALHTVDYGQLTGNTTGNRLLGFGRIRNQQSSALREHAIKPRLAKASRNYRPRGGQ